MTGTEVMRCMLVVAGASSSPSASVFITDEIAGSVPGIRNRNVSVRKSIQSMATAKRPDAGSSATSWTLTMCASGTEVDRPRRSAGESSVTSTSTTCSTPPPSTSPPSSAPPAPPLPSRSDHAAAERRTAASSLWTVSSKATNTSRWLVRNKWPGECADRDAAVCDRSITSAQSSTSSACSIGSVKLCSCTAAPPSPAGPDKVKDSEIAGIDRMSANSRFKPSFTGRSVEKPSSTSPLTWLRGPRLPRMYHCWK
mmetsp:Transcript_15096/g.52473  ORF Transcript_15096/g.52473 Transcript_15096/m.52473 type:complete len:254 (+) Transcript_15096:2404-3165(+)